MSYAPTVKDRQSSSKTSNKTHSYNNNKLASKSRSSINNNYSQRQPDTSQHHQTPISSIQDISRSIKSSSATSYSTNNNTNSMFQPKLRISQPGDVYEQEADRVAEKVMSMPEPELHGGYTFGKSYLTGHLYENQLYEQIQTPRIHASDAIQTEVPSLIYEVLSSPSQSLDLDTRLFMERRFGYNFHDVRVHSDMKAAESAQVVDAAAYTVGKDIVFAAGQYAPGSPAGRSLLAHELAHVVQQSTPLQDSDGQNIEGHSIKGIPIVHRRVRPSLRRPPRHVGGREGQRSGQRRPKGPTPRELKARERFRRKRLEEEIRREELKLLEHQKYLNQWALGEIRPTLRTPRQKAAYMLVKFFEMYTETADHWKKTHDVFDELVERRESVLEQNPNINAESHSEAIQHIDEAIQHIDSLISEVDRYIFEQTNRFEIELEKLIKESRERVELKIGLDIIKDLGPSIANAVGLVILFSEFLSEFITFKEKVMYDLNSIAIRIIKVRTMMYGILPAPPLNYQGPSMSAAE